MQESAQTDARPHCMLTLPEILDLKAAAPLAAEFLALRGMPVYVDAAQVTRLGGLCLQVLLSAAKTWNLDENPFTLVSPSADFMEGLSRLGVSSAEFACQGRKQ
jgi:chemotaxis protein CheX